MANTLKLGAGKWATGTDTVLAFNDENNNFKPLPFDFSRASSATVVNQSGLIETVGSGEPRIDFLGNTKGALLLEPQRTNSITYSKDFSSWIQADTSSVSIADSFDGSNNAYKVSVVSAGGFQTIRNTGLSVSGVQTFTIYAKKDTLNFTRILFGGFGNFWVDLQNGNQGTTTGSFDNITITSAGNGFFKIVATFTPTSAVTEVFLYPSIGNGNVSQTSGSVIFQYAQLEVGSYATSYIPTSGQSGGVTRVGDVCNNGANSQVINSTEGVLYLEGSALADDVLDKRIFLSDGTMNNYVAIGYSRFAGYIIAEMVTGGVLQTVDWGATGVNKTNNNKFALSWGSGTMKFYVNGNQTNTESVTSPTGLNVLEFNTAVDTLVMYSNTRDLRVYNTALTSAELQALTTI